MYKSGDVEMMDEQLRKIWSPDEISQEFYNTHEKLRLDLDRFKFVIQGNGVSLLLLFYSY